MPVKRPLWLQFCPELLCAIIIVTVHVPSKTWEIKLRSSLR
jgi:hypothetical protein